MAIVDDLWNMFGNKDESNIKKTVKATVLRKDEDGRIWVHVEGGVDETPIYSTTASVSAGDVVNVRIEGGKAYIDGSTSAPSIGVTQVMKVIKPISDSIEDVKSSVNAAKEASEASKRAADEAKDAASVTSQHFWLNENEPETYGGSGAHVTEQEKLEWVEAIRDGFPDLSDEKPYHNILMNSLGILLRTALNNLVSITRSSIAFFDGLGNNASNIVASFGKDGAQVGISNSHNLKLSSNSMGIYYGKDRLATFASDADTTEVHLGGSDKAPNAKYTNQEVEDAYEFIRTCHVSDEKIYDSDNNLTPYTLMVFSDTSYNVLDEDMEEFSSGQYNHIYYSVTDEEFYKSIRLSPQAEIPANVGIDVSAFRVDVDKDAVLVKLANDEEFRAIFGRNGAFSSGYGTVAKPYGQTAIGRYNVEDNNNTYALIVGNGTADNARSDAFTVDWGGRVQIQGSSSSGYITAKDISTAAISVKKKAVLDGSRYDSIIAGMSTDDSTWSLGVINNTIYLGRYDSSQTANAFTRSANYNLVSGVLTVTGLTTQGPSVLNRYLAIDNAGIDRDGTLPASDYWGDGIFLRDANDEHVGQVRPVLRTDGRIDMRIVAINEKNGADVANELRIQVDRSGNQTYSVSNPRNFRAAIGENGTVNATLNSTYTSGGQIQCIRRGDVVFYFVKGLALKAYSGRQQVATIPDGYRPVQVVYANFNLVVNTTSSYPLYIIFETNGAVSVDGGVARTVWTSACGIRA